jgi:hypothetical protein
MIVIVLIVMPGLVLLTRVMVMATVAIVPSVIVNIAA